MILDHQISSMHLGINVKITFLPFLEQVLESNSSFEATKLQASFVWCLVCSVYMISASNFQTPYKKPARIVKGPNIKMLARRKRREGRGEKEEERRLERKDRIVGLNSQKRTGAEA